MLFNIFSKGFAKAIVAMTFGFIVFAGTTTAISVMGATPANAKTCSGSKISATARALAVIKSNRVPRARKRALRRWRKQAKQFGSAFANFGNASDARITCNKPIKGQEGICTVSGRPCKP